MTAALDAFRQRRTNDAEKTCQRTVSEMRSAWSIWIIGLLGLLLSVAIAVSFSVSRSVRHMEPRLSTVEGDLVEVKQNVNHLRKLFEVIDQRLTEIDDQKIGLRTDMKEFRATVEMLSELQ